MTLARLFVAIGGLFVAALFVALIGPYFIDWTSYRDDFEREASRILGHEVEVLGSADARLLPFPSVTFNDVIVAGEEPGAPAMMRIERFSMDAELAPFLRGQVLIFDMRIDAPRARVRLLPDGTLDWALRRGNALPASSVVLESVSVTDGVVDLVDEQNGRSHRIEALDARLSAASLAGPWQIEGTAALNGHGGAFSFRTGTAADGRIRLRSRLLPDARPVSVELEGEARIEGAKPRYAGDFVVQVLDVAAISGVSGAPRAAASDGQAVARGRGRFALTNERLRIDEYRLEVGEPADPYVITGEATIDTGAEPEFLLMADGQRIDIDRLGQDGQPAPADADANTGAGAGAGGGSGEEAAPPALSPGERLAVLREVAALVPIPPMPGRASIVLPAVVAGDTTVREVSIEARPDATGWLIDHFSASLPGRTRIEADGRLEVAGDFGFDGNLLVAANQPSGLAAWLAGSVDPAIRTMQGAGFSARVAIDGAEQRFDDLELAIGQASATGRLVRRAGRSDAGAPSIELALEGSTIDLDAVRALLGLVTAEGAAGFAGHDVSAELAAERFSALGVVAGGLDARLAWRDGRLTVDALSVDDLGGASLALAGTLRDLTSEPAGRVDLELDAAAAGPLVVALRRLSGDHPLLDHLAAHAGAFDDTDLSVAVRLGGAASGFALNAEGTTGGSTLTVYLEGGNVRAPLSSRAITLELTAESPKVHTLLAQAGLPVLPVDADGPALLSLRLDGRDSRAVRLALALSAGDSRLEAEGPVIVSGAGIASLSGDLDLRLDTPDLEPYLLMAGIALPGFGAGLPVEAATRLVAEDGAVRFEGLEVTAGGNPIGGRLRLEPDEGGLALDGRLEVGTVSAGWLAGVALGPVASDGGDGPWPAGEFTPDSGPLAASVTADIALRAGRARLGRLGTAENLTGRLRADNGALDLDELSAGLAGGRLEGALRLANVEGSALVTARLALDGARLAEILGGWYAQPPAKGTLDLSLALEGSGKSPLALVHSLTGSGALAVEALAIEGFETGGFDTILARADTEGFEPDAATVRALAADVVSGGRFAAGSVRVPFTIAGGTVRATSIALADADAEIAGSARLDAATGALDSAFTVAFAAGDEALAGARPALRLELAGPLGDLSRSIDAGELTNYLSLRAFEKERRKVELLQAGVLEKQRMRRELALQRAEAEQRASAGAAEAERMRRAGEAARQRARDAQVPDTDGTGVPDAARSDGPAAPDAGTAQEDGASGPAGTPPDAPSDDRSAAGGRTGEAAGDEGLPDDRPTGEAPGADTAQGEAAAPAVTEPSAAPDAAPAAGSGAASEARPAPEPGAGGETTGDIDDAGTAGASGEEPLPVLRFEGLPGVELETFGN